MLASCREDAGAFDAETDLTDLGYACRLGKNETVHVGEGSLDA